MPSAHSLGREERLRRPADFKRVYARRCVVRDELLQICACENELTHARIGLSVARRWGKANVRNRIRRLYREAFRLSKEELPAGIDLVLIPRTAKVELASLMPALKRLADQAAKRLMRNPG